MKLFLSMLFFFSKANFLENDCPAGEYYTTCGSGCGDTTCLEAAKPGLVCPASKLRYGPYHIK